MTRRRVVASAAGLLTGAAGLGVAAGDETVTIDASARLDTVRVDEWVEMLGWPGVQLAVTVSDVPVAERPRYRLETQLGRYTWGAAVFPGDDSPKRQTVTAICPDSVWQPGDPATLILKRKRRDGATVVGFRTIEDLLADAYHGRGDRAAPQRRVFD